MRPFAPVRSAPVRRGSYLCCTRTRMRNTRLISFSPGPIGVWDRGRRGDSLNKEPRPFLIQSGR